MARGGTDIGFSCRCGALTGTLKSVDPDEGTHALCHCASCRRALDLYGIPGTRAEGVGIFQTTPDRIEIAQGAEHLGVMKLSPKGLYRWYAKCCGTPMFNTARGPTPSFVGVQTSCLSETAPLGPVLAEGFMDTKPRHIGLARMIWRFYRRALAARLTGRWRQTPFFDADGAPVAEPELAPRPEATP